MYKKGEIKMDNVIITLERQSEIIKLQTNIIDNLVLELLQNGVMTEKDLLDIKKVATMQKELQE